jgi:hypothetical protein
MKKITYLLSIVTLVVVSCSKNDTALEPTPENSNVIL